MSDSKQYKRKMMLLKMEKMTFEITLMKWFGKDFSRNKSDKQSEVIEKIIEKVIEQDKEIGKDTLEAKYTFVPTFASSD